MSFNVTFYTFAKKGNSTARPSAAGSTYACTGKAPLSVTAPRLQFKLADGAESNPTAWNYAYIPLFSRYYRIKEWTNSGPLWEAALVVDALASWRTQIGNQSCYVYRSAYTFDRNIADTLYPITAEQNHHNIPLSKPWTVGTDSDAGSGTANTYTVLCTVIGAHGTNYYAMTVDNWEKIAQYIYTNKYYQDTLGAFGAISVAEAKVAINPANYIQNLYLIPMPLGLTRWKVHTTGNPLSYIEVGLSIVPDPDNVSTLEAYKMPESGLMYWTETIEIPSAMRHPQASTRGEWLNLAPYSSYELFYPPFGIIPLDASEIAHARYLSFTLSIDPRIGECMLEVKADYPTGTESTIIFRSTAACGITIPLSGAIPKGSDLARTVVAIKDMATSLANPNPAGALSGVVTAYGNALHRVNPHLSSMGGPGSSANLYGQPVLHTVHYYMAPDDNTGRGRPLCAVRQLSTIPGYIMANSDELSIQCTNDEMTEIRSAIQQGFFYE